ncbi:helix-turn-helix domain-containing protein [Paenibacillus arenilitoris]|uniref:AraC family transcriptional regulator n=1 Tax=Paenibacillus arenilitoris TaxID=2772299 RepID=A0A927CSB3_9BACL|nr:helix-turn-helix domain-containing protein [Paenibacillus arenilitoris]MBD2871988.1 AraC family transcriptional regulator [Paenibacillus arenilitoris]
MKRKWTFGLNGKRKLFGKFLLSYVLILLIPLLVGTHAYYRTVQVVQGDAAELNLAVLEQSEEALHRLLTEIRDIVSLLSLDSELLHAMITADASWPPEAVYQFSQLQKNELNMLSTNQLISDLFVYLERSGAILSADRIDRLEAHPLTIGGVPFGRWLEDVLSGERLNRYLPLERVNNGRTTEDYVAYVSPLPAGTNMRADGAVVILIKESSIVRLFHRLLADNGSFAYILNEKAEMIVSASAGGKRVEPVNTDPQASSFVRIDGTETFISSVRSPGSGWIYVAGIPADSVFAKAQYIKRINWTIALAALVAGCVIALLLAYRNSKPIAELLDSIKEFAAGETGKRSSAMEIIHTAVHEIITNNKSMSVTMKRQLPLLQSAFLERMLKSGFNRESDMRDHLDQAGIDLIEDNAAAAVIRIHHAGYMPEEELTANKAEMNRVLLQELGEGCFVHDLKGEKLAVVLSFRGDAEERFNERIGKLRLLQARFLDGYSLMTSIGVGRVYGRLLDVWRSYNEAEQALEHEDPDVSQRLARYDCISRHSSHYYYPPDLELKLMHAVRTGDGEELSRLLEHIETQNSQIRQLSPWRRKQLIAEMRGTLQKIGGLIEYLPVDAGPRSEWPSGPETDGEEYGYSDIVRQLIAICDRIGRQKTSKYQEMLESMKAYIAANYADSSLSLSMLADDYKQSESFVSTFLKERLGMTFSEYLERLRLDEACRLLKETELPIGDIALRVGYNSDKSFRRAFKRALGIQPTSYRNERMACSE